LNDIISVGSTALLLIIAPMELIKLMPNLDKKVKELLNEYYEPLI